MMKILLSFIFLVYVLPLKAELCDADFTAQPLLFYQNNLEKTVELKLNEVFISEKRAKELIESSIAPEFYEWQGKQVQLKKSSQNQLTIEQRKMVYDYNQIIEGKAKSLKWGGREALLVNEMTKSLLPDGATFLMNEEKLMLNLEGVDLSSLSRSDLQYLYEFQISIKQLEKDPTNFRKVFDQLTNSVSYNRASLKARAQLVPQTYDQFLTLHQYKNSEGEALFGWIKKDLTDSQFTKLGGKRVNYRGPNGITLIENRNELDQLTSVEMIIERELGEPEKGVAFFVYDFSAKNKSGTLAQNTTINFNKKVDDLKVNSTFGCVSCHKILGAHLENSFTTAHPFGAEALTHPKIKEDIYPSSRTFLEIKKD